VAIDVIRATTVAVSAVAPGRRCLVAASLDDAVALRSQLGNALLAGELGGDMPTGFDLNNSPSELAARDDVERPLVMLSSSGTELMLAAGRVTRFAYVACFRNLTAVAQHLVGRHQHVALIGAGSRGEFREEDQMGCSWLAAKLLATGYVPEDIATAELVERWRGVPATAIEAGNSVAYLRRTDQLDDFAFIVGHIDDLDLVCAIEGNEIRPVVARGSRS
jgi:2-phosphosulfolactate phosphatase